MNEKESKVVWKMKDVKEKLRENLLLFVFNLKGLLEE
jgi:hypothetical protein